MPNTRLNGETMAMVCGVEKVLKVEVDFRSF